MSDANIVNIEMPIPHYKIRLVRAANTYFVANRGGFKTTRGIAPYVVDCVFEMPGSTGIICGPSFEHLGDNTINPLLNALNDFGMVEDEDYVVGTRPPEHFDKPLIGVRSKKYDHIISFRNGTNIIMVSMQKKGSSNGISCQWGVFDEVKLMKEKELMDSVFPAFRGNEKRFSTSPLFMSKFFATDKLADPGAIKWVLNKRNLNQPKKVDMIIVIQSKVNEMKLSLDKLAINQRNVTIRQIKRAEERLALLRKGLSFYVESSAADTVAVLGQQWLDDKKQALKPYEYKVAILNEDPDRPEDGFYPNFDVGVHTYDEECYDPNKPLIFSTDYQHSVAPICTCQIDKLPGQERESLNYIDELYTLGSEGEGLEEAVVKWCERYAKHQRKIVHYVYDQTATGKRVNADRYFEIVVRIMKRYGWKVTDVWTGNQPGHYAKYQDTREWMRNDQGKTLDIRINRKKCPKLIISITSAPAKTRPDGTTMKNKKSEQDMSLDQSETTHFSDVFDMINHAVLKLNAIRFTTMVSSRIAIR